MDRDDTNTRPRRARETRRAAELRVLLSFAAPYKGRIAAAAVALSIAAGTVLAFGLGLRWLVDTGLTPGADRLDQALIGLTGIVAVLAVATFWRAYLVSWIGERVAADLRRAVFDNVTRLDPAFYETTPTGEVLSRLTTDTTLLQSIIGSSASMALRNILMLAGGIVMMAITSLKLTALVLVVVPLVILPLVVFGRKVRRLSRASQDRIGDLGAQIDETLNAVRTVQAFNRQDAARDTFDGQIADAFDTAVRRVRARALLSASVIFLVFVAIGALLWIGGHDLLDKTITAGDLSAFLFFAVLAAGAVGSLSEFAAEFQRAIGAAERLHELLTAKPAIAAPAVPTPLPEAEGAVRFEAVSFAYPSRPDRSALHDFSLSVAPGETVALVGPSGAGKSTVFQLLLRYYDPQGGAISLDGVDIRAADPAEVRDRLGLVAQEPVIFSATLADNIAFGKPGATRAEIEAAARTAHLDFLEDLPEGLDTHVGQKGVQLSGGQRQRVAIARAILRDPAILLLDEATSALDAESERAVQQALDVVMVGRTTLVIAHRLATVLKADRIVVIDAGRVVAEGSHAELVAEGGLYARLAELQFRTDDAARPGMTPAETAPL
ncbi:MAG: ABC transporter transmembrane domain-containing protein [Bauldia litoralis]